MQEQGIGESQVTQVRGFADQRLRHPENPLDPSNRRISLIVEYTQKPPEVDVPKPEGEESKPATSEPASAPAESTGGAKK